MIKHLLAAFVAIALPASLHAQARVDFGDDEGTYPEDGECDDARFTGKGVSEYLVVENIGHDASDCAAKFDAGEARVSRYYDMSGGAIDFGDDEGDYVSDGECDDVRFAGGYGEEMVFLAEDIGHDASDCRTLYENGAAVWQGNLTHPEY